MKNVFRSFVVSMVLFAGVSVNANAQAYCFATPAQWCGWYYQTCLNNQLCNAIPASSFPTICGYSQQQMQTFRSNLRASCGF